MNASDVIPLFSGSVFDRADHLRSNDAELTRLLAEPGPRVLPLSHGRPLCEPLGDDRTRVSWLPSSAPLVARSAKAPVFLGLDAMRQGRFALDVSDIVKVDPPELEASLHFAELRRTLPQLSLEDASAVAGAKAVIEWHASHGFCSRCGAPNTVAAAGWKLVCSGCERPQFPRTDPVVIMLVTRGDTTLLGRHGRWAAGLYSLLAGFMEPGESIEEAVSREVEEESGLRVRDVRYLRSQPWPFPMSLMIGCQAEAEDGALRIDPHELEDARWFSRAQIEAALDGRTQELTLPGRGALAQFLLERWIEDVR